MKYVKTQVLYTAWLLQTGFLSTIQIVIVVICISFTHSIDWKQAWTPSSYWASDGTYLRFYVAVGTENIITNKKKGNNNKPMWTKLSQSLTLTPLLMKQWDVWIWNDFFFVEYLNFLFRYTVKKNKFLPLIGAYVISYTRCENRKASH